MSETHIMNAHELDHLAGLLEVGLEGDGLHYNDHMVCRANVALLIASHRALLARTEKAPPR